MRVLSICYVAEAFSFKHVCSAVISGPDRGCVMDLLMAQPLIAHHPHRTHNIKGMVDISMLVKIYLESC